MQILARKQPRQSELLEPKQTNSMLPIQTQDEPNAKKYERTFDRKNSL